MRTHRTNDEHYAMTTHATRDPLADHPITPQNVAIVLTDRLLQK
jgi:hypothetical protein